MHKKRNLFVRNTKKLYLLCPFFTNAATISVAHINASAVAVDIPACFCGLAASSRKSRHCSCKLPAGSLLKEKGRGVGRRSFRTCVLFEYEIVFHERPVFGYAMLAIHSSGFSSFTASARYRAYPPAITARKTPETICRWGVMAASLAKALSPLKRLWVRMQITRLPVLR